MTAGGVTAPDVERFFVMRQGLLVGVRDAAFEVRAIIDSLSMDIEAMTAEVCTGCSSVCCIHKHSRYDRSDLIFMTALGDKIPEGETGREDSAPCSFLGSNGCILERSKRPYRCTWFFCTPLLDFAMEKSGPAAYRKFVEMLQRITEKRTKMIRDFEIILLNNPLPPDRQQ